MVLHQDTVNNSHNIIMINLVCQICRLKKSNLFNYQVHVNKE